MYKLCIKMKVPLHYLNGNNTPEERQLRKGIDYLCGTITKDTVTSPNYKMAYSVLISLHYRMLKDRNDFDMRKRTDIIGYINDPVSFRHGEIEDGIETLQPWRELDQEVMKRISSDKVYAASALLSDLALLLRDVHEGDDPDGEKKAAVYYFPCQAQILVIEGLLTQEEVNNGLMPIAELAASFLGIKFEGI